MLPPARTIDVTTSDRGLYDGLQQEVDLGVQALQRGNSDIAITLFQSAIGKLTVDQPFYDHLVHNLLLSYRLQIERSLESGSAAEAIAFVNSALNLEICGEMAGDEDFRRRFAAAFNGLGLSLFKNGNYLESLACFRKGISIDHGPGAYINLTNTLAAVGLRARLSDYTDAISPEDLGRHIFIACVPKSASTFLKDTLVALTGYGDVFMVYAAGQTEHELYLPTILKTAGIDTVTQQHCRASDANIHLMQAFRIRPIVLVRNIFDSVMSLLDFYDGGAYFNSYFRADFKALDRETKIDLLIDNVIPWYLQFVASWDLVEKQNRLELMWLTYEDLISDKPAAIQKVLNFYGLGVSSRDVERKVRELESEGKKIRFNKGIAGRGRTGLDDRQKAQIRRLTRYYPSTDFSRIGL
jgi:tetratricopeptide (TPR) repeat protein